MVSPPNPRPKMGFPAETLAQLFRALSKNNFVQNDRIGFPTLTSPLILSFFFFFIKIFIK